MGHETVPAVLLDVVRYRLEIHGFGGRALDWRILEAAHAVELGFGQPVEQVLEVFLGLARKAHDEGGSNGQFRADLAPLLDARQGLVFKGRTLHGLEHFRAGMLEGDVQVRQELAGSHQRDHVIDVRVGIHVVQSHPHAHARQCLAQLQHPRLDRLAVPEISLVLDVDAVGAGVLRDHQDFLHTGLDQTLGFTEHIAYRAADQLAAHGRNDAETAGVVAAFGNLQVGVMARGQLDALRRDQIDEGVVIDVRRHNLVYGVDHLLVLLRAGHRQDAGVHAADIVFGDAHAAGDNHLAVLGDGFTDGVQRLGLGAVDEAAGIDHHHIGILVGRHDLVTLHAQLGQDAFRVDRGLGATQADEPDCWRFAHRL